MNGLGPKNVMAVDPAARQTVYAGGDGGLYKSTDGGAGWRKLPSPGANAVVLAVSPSRPEVILAITVSGREEQVYRSEDDRADVGARA